ncbi:MAG TPA: alpha/beta fold hydrolase [Candidatus Dormibacteraeota bacterium]|nr:alpha/beta fold hydrolase [Candidatus Dormibacteraeota bacterium]
MATRRMAGIHSQVMVPVPVLRTKRSPIRWILRVFALLLSAWLAASFLAEHISLHPPRHAAGLTPAHWGMSYSNVTFETADGLSLRGWWIRGRMHKTVVMIHGIGSNRDEPLSKSGYLHEAGYNVLVFDLRGSGQSDGSTTFGYREPLDASAAAAEAKRLDPGPVALFGYSLGAATAVEDAAVDPNVSAVIEDSGFSSASAVILDRFVRVTRLPDVPFAAAVMAFSTLDLGTSPWNVQPVAMAAQLHKPLLAIVGDKDTVVPPVEGFAIFDAAAGPKQLLDVPAAGHVGAYNVARERYEKTVLDFLAARLTD